MTRPTPAEEGMKAARTDNAIARLRRDLDIAYLDYSEAPDELATEYARKWRQIGEELDHLEGK